MDRYQLATLSSWGRDRGIQGRKRLQKVVFFLQAAGCPLGCRFTLHHYGPYSRDVADVCDEMVAVGLLQEEVTPNVAGAQYSYRLTPESENLLMVTAAQDPARVRAMEPFHDLGMRLLGDDLWRLELGSTILYFYRQSRDWAHAMNRACEFKKVSADAIENRRASELAHEVAEMGSLHSV
jgi:uncharacterized protein